MEITINEEIINKLVVDLVDTTTSQQFLSELYRISNASLEDKYETAAKMATLDNLMEKGIQYPDSMRIALRNFEIPIDTEHLRVSPDDPMVCYETGCASVYYNDTLITITLKNEKEQIKKNSPEEIKEALLKEFDPITKLVISENFQSLLSELYSLPEDERKNFVFNVILNSSERRKRGIEVPAGVYIRRSYFTDNRPTLFCVTRQTPLAAPWDKATITFDNPLNSNGF
jgi:hypothetical protein